MARNGHIHTHTHKAQTSKGDNWQLATGNRGATTKQPWGNNKNNNSDDEHFVNPVFMRNYVFFALVSQAVSETSRAEQSRIESAQSVSKWVRGDPRGYSSCEPSYQHAPSALTVYPFALYGSVSGSACVSSYETGFSCLFFSAVAFVAAALYLSQWKAFLFHLRYSLPAALCVYPPSSPPSSPYSSRTVPVSVYLHLCLRLCSSPAYLPFVLWLVLSWVIYFLLPHNIVPISTNTTFYHKIIIISDANVNAWAHSGQRPGHGHGPRPGPRPSHYT